VFKALNKKDGGIYAVKIVAVENDISEVEKGTFGNLRVGLNWQPLTTCENLNFVVAPQISIPQKLEF